MDAAEISMEAYFRRQMTAIGVGAMEQVSLMHVLVVGLRGCGMEIAKCLALGGVQRLTLMDEELVREEDLAVGFLLREGDQGKPKAKLVASRLNELAPFADVRILNGALSLDLLLNFHVVVFASVNGSLEELIAFDEFCRAQDPPIGVVVAESRGLFGSVFTDFSGFHQSMNTTHGGGDVAFTVVARHTQVHDEDRVDTITIVVRERLVNAYFEPGDHVALYQSDDDANPLQLEVVAVQSDVSLRLRPVAAGSSRNDMQARLRGLFTRLRRVESQVFTATHRSLRERVITPGSITLPMSFTGDSVDPNRGHSLHMASVAVYQFRREFGVLPNSNSADHVGHMMTLVDELLQKNAICKSAEGVGRRDEIDTALVTSALRCASSELLPLSALVAGHAALQVLKFSGALGPLLHPTSQYLYFDVINLASGVSSSRNARDSSVTAIFGAESYARLQNSTVAMIGTGPTNTEVMKNLICCGFGSDRIRLVLDQDENALVQAEDLHGRVLFSPGQVGQNKVFALSGFRNATIAGKTMNEGATGLHWGIWTTCSAVVAEVSSVQSRLAIDSGCRVYEKPTLFTYEDERALRRIDLVIPHITGTVSERVIPPRRQGEFLFDYIPTRLKPLRSEREELTHLRVERLVQHVRQCFDVIFRISIQVAIRFMERSASSNKALEVDDTIYDEDKVLWMVWSVAQRGHRVEDFKDCIRVAWVLLELLPLWINASSGNHSTKSADDDDISSENRFQQVSGNSNAILALDENDPDQIQLLVATACIVASSVQIAVPPVENRRVLVAQVAQDARAFSLRHNPRTPTSIQASFAAIDSSHMLGIVGRVQGTTLDLDDVHNGHLHFLQALANVQLGWSERNGARINTIPQLRRLCRVKREFLPMETILGALKTLQLIQVLLTGNGNRAASEDMREYVSSATPIGSKTLLQVTRPPEPLVAKSMALEVTRGVQLRVIPEEMSRWTRIAVPASPALQSVKALVSFVETKFKVCVHAIHHDERCIATISPRAMSAADGPLTQSIFDLCGSSAPFVVLDLVAVDAQGDVVLAPLRMQRKA